MKKTLCALFLISSYAVHAQEFHTYSDVVEAVTHGKKLNFVFDLKNCVSDEDLPSVIGSVQPNAFVVTDEKVTASLRHFTMDNPDHKGVPVYDYLKFNIDTQGDVTISLKQMYALTYTVLHQSLIDCQLGKGFRVYG